MRILLILACLPLFGFDLGNTKTVHNQTASQLASYPFTLHYWLAQGEVTGYPRPYLTPSDTNIRAAATEWQADVKSRWRDSFRQRDITGVLSGDTTVAIGNGLTSIVVANSIGTVTTTAPHGFTKGSRIVVSGATTTGLNRDHYVIISAPPTPTTFQFRTQGVSNGTYYNVGLTVTNVIEPWGSGQCRLKSPSHRLEPGDSITVADVVGMVGVNGSWTVSATSKDEFLINTTCSGTFVSGGTVTGPDFGSVKTALVSFTGTVPASGNLRVDVIPSTNACHVGSVDACIAAAPSTGTMTAAGLWDAQIELTADVVAGSTATKTANAKLMLAAWDGVERYCGPRYWLRGPVVTQWIVEYGCEGATNYDFGWKTVMSSSGTNGNTLNGAIDASQTSIIVTSTPTFGVGDRLWFQGPSNSVEIMDTTSIAGNTVGVNRGTNDSTAQAFSNGKQFGVLKYQDDAAFLQIHPSFAVTYYPGWSGVKVQARIENNSWTKQSTMWLTPTIKTGDSLSTRWTRGETAFFAGSGLAKDFWVGSDPDSYCAGGSGTDPDNCSTTGGGSKAMRYYVDHNQNYLTHAGALPPLADVTPDLTTWYGGFDTSDKGDFGVIKYVRNGSTGAVIGRRPLLYPGMGVGQLDNPGGNWAPVDWSNGSAALSPAEGWWPVAQDAMWIMSGFEPRGYDIVLGTRVPGGGGHAAVENSVYGFGRREDLDNRIMVAGWPDSSYNRPVSLHSRPGATGPSNWGATSSIYGDRPGSACGQSVVTDVGSTLQISIQAWPCGFFSTGSTLSANGGIGAEPGHMPEYQWLAWLVTGSEWFQHAIALKGAGYSQAGHAPPIPNTSYGRNMGKITAGYPMSGANHIRIYAWPALTMVNAWASASTELLYGQDSTPEYNLFSKYLMDLALTAEGLQNVTDGWAARLFPLKWTSSCTGYSTSLTDATSSDQWRLGRCGLSGSPNGTGYFSPVTNAALTADGQFGLDPTKIEVVDSWHQMSYPAAVFTRAKETGSNSFLYARKGLGKWFVNAVLNRNHNGFMTGVYRNSVRMVASHARFDSWAEVMDSYTTQGKNHAGWNNGGSWLDVKSFAHKFWSGVARISDVMEDSTTPGCTPADRPPNGCTAIQALAFFENTLHSRQSTAGDPRWIAARPRQAITNVSATLSGGTASIRWVAPTGAACTVAINPTSSLNTDDTTATAAGRIQSFSGSAAAGNVYRITCDKTQIKGVL